ncbi:hypothetical protein C7S18_19635 [Ahniella affigens]|uniref:Uncharacterized protein n=1 Tax=Ahniella affigens TaxID=2021234 RepID=A0A2P1PWK9_9GAMM|nr:hypothetical protein C7S18_19635 [Ahniella affigens]
MIVLRGAWPDLMPGMGRDYTAPDRYGDSRHAFFDDVAGSPRFQGLTTSKLTSHALKIGCHGRF